VSRRITVSEKLLHKIDVIISRKLCLSDVPEFDEYGREPLFQHPPEDWNDLERAIHEYTLRKVFEIRESIREELSGNKVKPIF